MSYRKKWFSAFLYLALVIIVVPLFISDRGVVSTARAEKEEMYTSSEEFLPLGAAREEEGMGVDLSFLEDETLIHRAQLAGIKFLKEEDKLIFTLKAEEPNELEDRDLKFEVFPQNCPPRIIIRLYGVRSDERVFRFFKNLDIRGVISNPFIHTHMSEYVIFFENWVDVTSSYSKADHLLTIKYSFSEPPFRQGFGVRIADTQIDPLPHIVEIKRELTRYGLSNFLLLATDEETVVLESPFYNTREEAIDYIEALEGFGFKGKLAIRDYRDFPKPHRFDVVSEVVITGEGDVNLENIVYTELMPEKIYILTHSELYLITKEIFSPRVQNDEELIAEYYYSLSEIYRNYETSAENVRNMSILISIKLLEIIYFNYPKAQRADDALWDMANLIRDYGIRDRITEVDCYQKIVSEYPDSIFLDESMARMKSFAGS